MQKIEEVFEMVEKIAANRPRHSSPTFLPKQIPELAVLTLLETTPLSGDMIIRRLTPLNRYASAFGVSYKLIHDLEGNGVLQVELDKTSHRRTYRLTNIGQERLQELRTTYALASEKDWQIDFNFNLINLLNPAPLFNEQVA
jgi:DNA-binding PadR family transcriptional regulator